ncbi:MAG: GMC family oxidoreductase N-terminal domain-containing protein [Thermodesulfobacteriota bacterium]
MNNRNLSADVVVVGSGPGGATIARDLTLAGKKVIIVEWGKDNKPRGNMHTFIKAMGGYFTSLGKGLMVTPDLLMMVRAVTVGGTTMFYTASAWDPPYEKLAAFGVNLPKDETEKIKKELKVGPLPDDRIGPAARAIMTSARDLGYDWKKLNKFIDPSKARIGCMDTFCGDKSQAKWEAYQWVMDAVNRGARLLPQTLCEEVIVSNGTTEGVRVSDRSGREYEIGAKVVVICAGGVGSPTLLQRSGIEDAGRKFFFDPFVLTNGYIDGKTEPGKELAMAAGMHLEEDGIMMTDMTNPWFQSIAFNILAGRPGKAFKSKGQVSIMTKARDVMDGVIDVDGRISKPLTAQDREKLNRGKIMARKILKNMGARDIWNGALGAAHPGGTCRIGHIVDSDLQTRYKNLFVSDGSVIPFEFGLPPVLTILTMSRRLSGHLLKNIL